MKFSTKRVAGALALAATLAGVPAARADFLEDAGWGSLTVLSNLGYMPVKVLYSGLGGLTGGLAYGLTVGDLDVANKVWVPSMAGTYVLTPEMLRGDKEIAFVGGDSPTAAARSRVNELPAYRPAPLPDGGEGDLAEENLGGS
jgi:hypothetical protein